MTVAHSITTVDCQPTLNNGVLVFVVGQLKVLNYVFCSSFARTMIFTFLLPFSSKV